MKHVEEVVAVVPTKTVNVNVAAMLSGNKGIRHSERLNGHSMF